MSQAWTITDPQDAAHAFCEKVRGIWLTQLTTRAPDGQLRGRPMTTQQVEYDSDLWFFTDARSAKVKDIGVSPEVHLAYSHSDGTLWIDVSGQAETVNDPVKKEELWFDDLQAYFPEGRRDPHLVLIKVTPTQGEYWQGPDRRASDDEAAQQTQDVKLVFAGR
ncbi:general stress protein [Deinococcus sp. Arct2-2]|uniref:pyridoxamine 5'-phosphate oxidase family protein n=1 Tax=Deinococcus sp. Arct2-2 TaxID=2568653 RepID=UPI0010A411C2|nr:pyridoxamine 5'-phosphate oxidase family protein [Deinococcus sp. Arct2-2]THF67711.1 general stress protein [Deinococcus sp. Arct2-2]